MNIAAYDAWLARAGVRENTHRQRVSFLRSRLAAWGTLDVPAAVIEEYLDTYSNPHTRRTYYGHLASVYAWAVEQGRVLADPMAEVTRPPTPRPRPRPLTRSEAARTLAASSGHLRAWLLLGRYAGLRAHEIAKIRGEDINEETLYVCGKGGQEAIIPTHPKLWRLAQSYPRIGWWFPTGSTSGHVSQATISTRTTRLFRSLGIEGSSHRNRHLYGTELLRAGANVRVVQELMRHATLATTVMYLGVDEDDKRSAILSLAA